MSPKREHSKKHTALFIIRLSVYNVGIYILAITPNRPWTADSVPSLIEWFDSFYVHVSTMTAI